MIAPPVTLADAYSATASAWQAGPGQIYDVLAHAVVRLSPVPLDGRLVLDLGAGTGAASRAVAAAGGRAVAVDAALGMLAHDRVHRPPAVAGDARTLPLRSGAVEAVVAAFSLNHLDDPAAGLAEAARVTRPGGAVVASAYAADDGHPVKQAVESALSARGWTPPPWYQRLKAEAMPRLATRERCEEAAIAAGLDAQVHSLRIRFARLSAHDLVAWRMGMAQHAAFLAELSPTERNAVSTEALRALGQGWPELERSILVLTAAL